jgi:arginine exporter protein ArgO
MTAAASRSTAARTPVQTVAIVVGIVFLLVGVLGFIPGITTGYDTMGFAGMGSMAMLLGLFQVSILHNIVHLLFGIVGLLSARTARGAKLYLIIGGIVYGVLWLYGLVIDNASSANFVPLNTADNWLHFVLAVGMILLGVLVKGDRRAAGAQRA